MLSNIKNFQEFCNFCKKKLLIYYQFPTFLWILIFLTNFWFFFLINPGASEAWCLMCIFCNMSARAVQVFGCELHKLIIKTNKMALVAKQDRCVLIVCTTQAPFLLEQEGGERLSLLPNFQKGGLDRISIFRVGCWERGGWLFSEGIAVFT